MKGSLAFAPAGSGMQNLSSQGLVVVPYGSGRLLGRLLGVALAELCTFRWLLGAQGRIIVTLTLQQLPSGPEPSAHITNHHPTPPDPAHPLLLPPSAWSVGSRTTHFPKLPSLPEAPFLPSSDGQPQILLRHGFSRVLPVSIPVCVGHHTELPHPRACPEPGHSCTSPPGLQWMSKWANRWMMSWVFYL